MADVNLEVIAYKLEQISQAQTTNSEENKKRFDAIETKLSGLDQLNKSVDDLEDWKKVMDKHASVTSIVETNEWKKQIDELISPKQLEQRLKDIEDLKTFKTKALMIFVVIQAIMGVVVFWAKIFGG